MPVRLEKVTKVWELGIQSILEPELIKRGGFSSGMNFIASIDKVELVAGRKVVGVNETSSKACLGLGSIQMQNGSWVLFRKNDTKLQYYDSQSETWKDSKTGLLPDEPLYSDSSFTPAGRQFWACGQDGLLKIYPSSPASPLDLTDPLKNYKGKLRIEKSRMIVIGMKEDPTGLRLSKVDRDSNYTSITGEAISTATDSHYTGTLAHGQCFGLVFKKGLQKLTDDKNGILSGDGTGTINYATGEYVLDFTTSNADAVSCDYIYEDSLVNGLADFTYSSPRIAGEGNILRQDSTGTKSLTFLPFNNSYYTLQDKGSWYLTISSDDLTFKNDIFNTMISSSSGEGAVEVKNGIIFIDTTEIDNPKLRKLVLNDIGDKVVPEDLSDFFNLKGYVFDEAPMIQFNDFILFSGKSEGSEVNDTLFVYNLMTKGFFVVSGGYNYFTIANGAIYGGDSSSPNVYELFQGYTDLGFELTGELTSGNDNLDTEQVKKVKKFYIEGYLSGTREFEIYMIFDKGTPVYIGEITMADILVSSPGATLGSVIYGDDLLGGSRIPVKASWFKKAFRVSSPKFERVAWKIVPKGLGYLAITQVKYSDIRKKGTQTLRKYKIT